MAAVPEGGGARPVAFASGRSGRWRLPARWPPFLCRSPPVGPPSSSERAPRRQPFLGGAGADEVWPAGAPSLSGAACVVAGIAARVVSTWPGRQDVGAAG